MELTNASDEVVEQAVAVIRHRYTGSPKTAIILGSGLGGLADEIEDAVAFPYASLPGFAQSTAHGHQNQLIAGKLDGVDVIAMAGRFHRYEGYSDAQVAYPVRVFAALGATQLIASNAAGGLWPSMNVGDIVVIRDHIDLGKKRPARAASSQQATDALPVDRMESAVCRELYDPSLIELALEAARRANFHAQSGVYLATLGPTYETRAEYRMMRFFNADVVGMSTAPEVRVAVERGMRVLALSMVSNVARPDVPVPADHEEVLAAGRSAAFKLRAIVSAALGSAR
jgi:purine-nucleoside phosphorylase